MARRRTPSARYFEKSPGVYARTSDTWTTRYYNRKQDPLFDMFGLSTAPDDLHKKDGSSPYLTNVRYMGDREEDQRSQVMSRKGAKPLAVLGESVVPRAQSEGDTYLEIYEGKAIEWEINHSRLLTGISLFFENVDSAAGFVKLTIRNITTKQEITNAVVDLRSIPTDRWLEKQVRFIKAVVDTRVLVRAEILDDITNDEVDLVPDKRAVRILSTLDGVHSSALYDLPNRNDALEEVAYSFIEAPCKPLTGTLINDWEPMVRGEEFVSGGVKYMAFPVRHDGVVEIFKTNLATNDTSVLSTMVDPDAKTVRFDQAEGYLYYVDAISPLRRINLTTFVSEDVIPLAADITIPGVLPAALTAKVGASLIHFLNNRLYLSGFKDDPNLVITSLIDDVKPRFEQYNDRFYSPDQSPELSSGSPITALADISDYLIVFRIDGLSMYDYGPGTSASAASQQTPEGAQLGVMNQEAVCQGKNNLYFFNPVEGVCRFAGNVNRPVSNDIINLLKRIKNKDKIFMVYQNQCVRMYFSFEDDTPDSCFYYYTILEGQLPWYMDINTPVSSAIPLKDSETIIAVHSQVPAVMQVDAQFTDFDSYIVLEYHTQYRTPPTSSPSGWTYLRRLHVHELTKVTHSMYIGLDTDHRDRPVVWRRFIEAPEAGEINPDAIFQQTAEAGTEVISIPMYIKCRNYQIRIKRYCYKDQGEIVGWQSEYGNKDPI